MASNFVLSIATIIFSIFFLVYSAQLPAGRPGATTLGPAAWPAIVLTIMLIMGIALLIQSYRQRKLSREEVLTEEEKLEQEFQAEIAYPRRHWVVLGIIILYLSVMSSAGFIVATLLFIFFGSYVLGLKKWVYASLTSVISTTAIVFLFGKLLAVPFPRGVGLLRELSFLFY